MSTEHGTDIFRLKASRVHTVLIKKKNFSCCPCKSGIRTEIFGSSHKQAAHTDSLSNSRVDKAKRVHLYETADTLKRRTR
ncbi:MAG: hypothetical protein BWK80_60120 [Desulfobacteraceae bacterium IS3]|nr:MAG: hypothetical protein BWK80_60120 [Desulfobacteraceae bacterium IS3]